MDDRKMNREETDQVILFPDYELLKQEVEKLRTELSMLVLEKDELVLVEAKNLEMKYMLEIGATEYRAFEAQCAMLRLKRKAELIQSRKNRQEKVIIADIDRDIDEEYAEYQQKLNDMIEDMNRAIERSKEEVLSEEDRKELKKLYRRVIKELHPDMHPELDDGRKKLFFNAVDAYENGDLKTMRMIAEMTAEPAEPDGSADAMKTLAREKERLAGVLKDLKAGIEKIRSSYPFTVMQLLSDPEKISEKKQELEEIIRQYMEAIQIYQMRIDEMTGR